MEKRISVEISGKGPALVLIHGWGLNSGVWHQVSDKLAQHFTIYAVDLPGFGQSYQIPVSTDLHDWVDAVIEVVQTPAIWLGWSLGGLVATQAAISYPAQVTQLVTVASSPKFVADEQWLGIKPNVLEMFQSQLKNDFEITLQRFLAIQAMGSETAKQDIRDLHKVLKLRPIPSAEALSIGLALLGSVDLRSQLGEITQPFLRFYGRLDSLVSQRVIKEIDALAPQSEKYIFDKASHAPFISHSDEFVEALLQRIK